MAVRAARFLLFAVVGVGIALVGILLSMLPTPGRLDAARPLAAASDPQKVVNSPACDPDWLAVSSPNGTGSLNRLYGIAAVSPDDVWSVGLYQSSGPPQALMEHWDGSTWNIVPSPNPGSSSNDLRSVSVVAANDVWAVGNYKNLGMPTQTLVEHWDGTNWSVVASPSPGDAQNYLYGVSAIGANDVWTVGYYHSNGFFIQTLTEHWDGSVWSIVPSPNAGTGGNLLRGVAAIASNDVWAAGSGIGTLTLHWDGGVWSIVPSPNVPDYTNTFFAVAAATSNDVWAVGFYHGGSLPDQTLTEHWDGSTWSIISSPTIGYSGLLGVDALSTNDAWAVGSSSDSVSAPSQTLVEHWNGSTWSVIASPNVGTGNNSLAGISAASTSDVFAAGASDVAGLEQTLVEQYNACSPTPSPTPGGPLPTACPIQFTDVPVGDPFYAYIRCLACRNIVGGYNTSPPCVTGTPCFLPSANITRGQISKFIANAAGYNDQVRANLQTFTDVPNTNTFWLYIERSYLHGVINGYSDSARCSTGIPCFLPGDTVTRGQTAKFVSNAAAYSDSISATTQTFTDVPNTFTFWLYIERVYLHGVVGGYTDPARCPTGIPCFNPADDVTRGQTAKFISNAFYPQCDTPRKQ